MKDKIERIKSLLNEANKSINSIANNNFDQNFSYVKKLLNESQKDKSFLLANYSKEELMIFEPELTKLTKQLKKSFDNIIENKKLELDRIKGQMRHKLNQKKLVNYIR
jgi:hypothetical protein